MGALTVRTVRIAVVACVVAACGGAEGAGGTSTAVVASSIASSTSSETSVTVIEAAAPATTVVPEQPVESTPSVLPSSTMSSIAVSTIVTAPTSPVPQTAPTATCSAASWTAQVGDRAVLVRQPEADRPVPIVIAIHGYKGTPEGLEYYSELTSIVGASAIVAFPSGSPLDLGFGWNSGAGRFATRTADDVAVVLATLDLLGGLSCADSTRAYVVGESNGGGMAVRVACDPRSWGRLTGAVLVNAAVDDGVLATCAPGAPSLSVLAVAGLEDRVVPYDGSREPFLPVESWFGTVSQRLSGCDPSVVGRTPWSDRVGAMAATGCAVCAQLFVVADGPHTWPGSFEGINGTVPGSFELTSLLDEVVRGIRPGCGAPSGG